jgi:hypothetical protein
MIFGTAIAKLHSIYSKREKKIQPQKKLVRICQGLFSGMGLMLQHQ